MLDKTIYLIDLFCGAGGLATGFSHIGFETALASDIWKPAVETYVANYPGHRFIRSDVRDIQTIAAFAAAISRHPLVVAGGPPCQGFSSAGARKTTDERNTLVGYFAQLAASISPEIIVFENVEGFLTLDGGKYVVDLLKPLIEAGYRVRLEKHNVANFGVPQFRKRVIGIAAKGRHPLALHPITSAQGMPGANLVGAGLPRVQGVLEYLDSFQLEGDDPLNAPGNLSENDQQRIGHIGQGQTMRDLPPELQHSSWNGRANRRVKDGTPSDRRGGAPTGMRRLIADQPSKAITSAATREFIHPVLNRFLTQREAALLQTFPPEYRFVGNRSEINTLIGNAIPPKFAESIGQCVAATLEEPVDDKLLGGIDALTLTNSTGLSPALKRTLTLVNNTFGFAGSDDYLLF